MVDEAFVFHQFIAIVIKNPLQMHFCTFTYVLSHDMNNSCAIQTMAEREKDSRFFSNVSAHPGIAVAPPHYYTFFWTKNKSSKQVHNVVAPSTSLLGATNLCVCVTQGTAC